MERLLGFSRIYSEVMCVIGVEESLSMFNNKYLLIFVLYIYLRVGRGI